MKSFEINERTGNQETEFEATLLSLGENVRENANGTKYKIANIEFADVNGELQKTTAMVYAGNYNYGMEEGKTYLSKATLSGDQVYITMSHLQFNTSRPTVDMFGFSISTDALEVLETRATSKSRQVITEDELADF